MINVSRVIDEIALEGIDDITLECLFKRLRVVNNDQPLEVFGLRFSPILSKKIEFPVEVLVAFCYLSH